MENINKNIKNAMYDLQRVLEECLDGNQDNMELGCCLLEDVIFQLKETRKALVEKCDEVDE